MPLQSALIPGVAIIVDTAWQLQGEPGAKFRRPWVPAARSRRSEAGVPDCTSRSRHAGPGSAAPGGHPPAPGRLRACSSHLPGSKYLTWTDAADNAIPQPSVARKAPLPPPPPATACRRRPCKQSEQWCQGCRPHSLSALSLLSATQDQAGQYDWLKQHVGRVSTAVLTSGPQPAIYAASADAGTLAALAPADGHLLWRRVLAEGDAVTRLVVARKQVLTLSAGGTQLMAWDAATGAAAWVADLAREAATDVAVLGRDVVAVSVGSTIKVSKRVLLGQLSNEMPRGRERLLRVVCNGQCACPTCSAMPVNAIRCPHWPLYVCPPLSLAGICLGGWQAAVERRRWWPQRQAVCLCRRTVGSGSRWVSLLGVVASLDAREGIATL